MADDQGDKTEHPSQKKFREAREKGQVARSRDIGVAITSLSVTGMIVWFGPLMVQRLAARMTDLLMAVGDSAGRDVPPEDMTSLVLSSGAFIGLLVGPIAVTAAVMSVASAAAQGGLRFSATPLQFNWSRLNPSTGLSRLVPSRSGIDTLKTVVTVIALLSVAWPAGRALAVDSLRFPWMSPTGAAGYGWSRIVRLLWQAGFTMLAIGAADYGVQFWRFYSGLKMTKQEVRDEGKASDGSAEVKGRVRRIQQDMRRKRMLAATATATVVVTNPTHYAVALEYRREKSPAPIVVAKGRDLVAQRIRAIARENGVPIIENPPLARALHAGAEIGDTIPAALFGAVAEVLAYLIRIKQLML